VVRDGLTVKIGKLLRPAKSLSAAARHNDGGHAHD
jgi:hypothetical protein